MIILIVLVIVIFPKDCGTIPSSRLTKYTCYGIEASFLSKMQKSENKTIWCSGICVSKSIKKEEPENPSEKNKAEGMPDFLSGFIDSITSLALPLGIIILVIILVYFIAFIQQRFKESGYLRTDVLKKT